MDEKGMTMRDEDGKRRLTAEALRILKQIEERGLTVLWSFRVPHPTYDDGTTMSADDWRICNRELWHVVEKQEWVKFSETYYAERSVVQAGGIQKVLVYIMPDGSEREQVQGYEYNSSRVYNEPDGTVISERHWVDTDARPLKYSVWKSDYIVLERIKEEEYLEEYVGLRDRYTLTDKAKALIST